ncbi:nucleotide exchange factor GrpE [Cryobacterium aureum]|uniref:nucleotide exchange factor GrpE n=1 Tax=Cryobacterium aureum TaxID=995037 RepID=UPI000CF3B649|nr:nucleotide exchange factor GrpE [Cryobacterium aureum]
MDTPADAVGPAEHTEEFGAQDETAEAEPAEDTAVSEPPATNLSDIVGALEALSLSVERLSDRARSDQDIITRMQHRIDELQGDQMRALMGPAVSELAKLHAEVLASADLDYARLGVERVQAELARTADGVIDAINVLGADSIDAQLGEAFNSQLHTAVRRVPTNSAKLDRTIAEVQRQGFRFEGVAKPALYARVKVFAFEAEPEALAEVVLDHAKPEFPEATPQPLPAPIAAVAVPAESLDLPFEDIGLP